jgi:rare lipoprotein A
MTVNFVKSKRVIQLGLSAIMMVGLSACASTSVVKMTESAPITYKIGQGSAQYASLTLPKSTQHTKRPSALPVVPRQSAPQVNTGPKFDPLDVDKELYAHQRVGKRYTIAGKSYTPKHKPNYDETGIASWYGEKFHGRPTATGETYNMHDITAAHKTLPLNSMLHVENLENGRTLVVRLNDRGPFADGRIIDLSKAAAKALGTLEGGLARVRVRYIGPADPNAPKGPIATPPVYQEAPAQIVEAPAIPYVQPETALPSVPQDFFDVPRAAQSEPNYNPIAPSAPTPAPGLDLPEDGGQVTLTIKGPIHIAKYDGEADKPEMIMAVNRRTYKTTD